MTSLRVFDHIIIIMFENEYGGYVLQDPYMKRLADQGICLENSFGVMHPSQTNYIASTAGALCNVTSDSSISPPLVQRNIVDLIEESHNGLRWKAYMDSYRASEQPWSPDMVPEDQCMPNGNSNPCPGRGPYVVKHNPFFSFRNIIRNKERWAKVDDEIGFMNDVKNGTLPEYSWFTPNMWNDGHWLAGTDKQPKHRPKLIAQLSAWLKGFFDQLNFPGPNSLLPSKSLVVLTFDEADFEDAYVKTLGGVQGYEGVNVIYTVLLGDMISPGVVEEGYNHYSLLRTVEKNFDLDDLGTNDVGSNWYQFLWGKKFTWGSPTETPIPRTRAIASGELEDLVHVVYVDGETLCHRWLRGEHWSQEDRIGRGEVDVIAMARCGNELMLVSKMHTGGLSYRTFSAVKGWSAPTGFISDAVASFSVSTIDEGQSMMLAYSVDDGDIRTMVYSGGKWGAAQATGHRTDGSLTVGAIGASVYLVFKTIGANTMSVASYNTADFNVLNFEESEYFGSFDNTTKDRWSPDAFPVRHYSKGPNPATPGEVEPIPEDYQGSGPFVTASLDGVLHLIHRKASGEGLLTESFSVAGILTPKNRVSYDIKKLKVSSNGFGTLYQAGWNKQKEVTEIDTCGELAMASTSSQVALFFQPVVGRRVLWCSGRYV